MSCTQLFKGEWGSELPFGIGGENFSLGSPYWITEGTELQNEW